MDYEKAYNKALEMAKSAIKDCGDNKGRISMIESIFPELKESEDEKIRKTLLDSFEYQIKESHPDKEWLCGVKLKEIVSWLEKQKSVSEIVERCKNSWYNEGKIAGMTEGLTDDEKYQQGWHDALEKQGEQKPIMNVPTRELIFSIWDLGNEWKELTNGRISEKYGTQLNYIQKHWHDALEKQGEQKSSWCEDDERIVTALMEGFRYHQLFNPRFGEVPNAEIISWIKSLKERLS